VAAQEVERSDTVRGQDDEGPLARAVALSAHFAQSLMMLTTDMALTTDKSFRKHAEVYAKDQDTFFRDFAAAFGKMLENGVPVANFKSEPMLLKTSDEAVA
jgi:catalase (peroxidase I)